MCDRRCHGVPAIARITRVVPIAAAILFAAFVIAKGIPTLRHDWNWPIDRAAIPSFAREAFDGWLPAGLGMPNPHPTTYLISVPIASAMWLFGPLATLALLAAAIAYLCMRVFAALPSGWRGGTAATIGIGLFAVFNPWVYNEVVAGHLVMVLAYAGLIGLFAEMLRGRGASTVRLALWVALVSAQLQFFILAMLALAAFAIVTRKWLPLLFGTLFALPSVIGLAAERGTLVRIPYEMTWQANQSVPALALLGLGGYFPGYADRLGIAAAVAVWIVLAIAVAGAIVAYRTRAAVWALAAAALLYVAILGVHGPVAGPYGWIVRNVPESGVFRELYDLAGVMAALIVLLACAAIARVRWLGYVVLAVGIALPITWLLRPPSDLWIGSSQYRHPAVAALAHTRIALLPAFQPVGLRGGGGNGADPDAFVYPGYVAALNEYFPTYPVDMALARYEQSGDATALRALGVGEIVPRPWLVSRTHGGIGVAAFSLQPKSARRSPVTLLRLDGATPLFSECSAPNIVGRADPLGACDVFFGDAAPYPPVYPIVASGDSIDPGNAWIDARLAFAESPGLAQAIGGVLTQSRVPFSIEPGSWLLAYVRGELLGSNGGRLARSPGSFVWVRVPLGVASVECVGLCELIAKTPVMPALTTAAEPARTRALRFTQLTPWLYLVEKPASSARLLRFNERYDSGWTAFAARRMLQHVRVDMSVNGWLLESPSDNVVLVQVTALLQLIAEILGVLCVLWLLKALALGPTKRAR